MKKQFLHEHHNRQEKVQKPHYLEDLRNGPRTNDIPGETRSTAPSPANYAWRVTLSIEELNPAVVAAVRKLNPAIDITRVLDAVRSGLGRQKATIRVSGIAQGLPPKVRGAVKTLLVTLENTVEGRFCLWHEQAQTALQSGLTCECEVPVEFHQWLEKMTPNQTAQRAGASRLDQELHRASSAVGSRR